MTSKHKFSPLCDLHHVPMRHVMREDDPGERDSYHLCERRDCTRIFRQASGYSDRIAGAFDDARSSTRECPQCGSVLYLAAADRLQKMEVWECVDGGCEFSDESRSPSAR